MPEEPLWASQETLGAVSEAEEESGFKIPQWLEVMSLLPQALPDLKVLSHTLKVSASLLGSAPCWVTFSILRKNPIGPAHLFASSHKSEVTGQLMD
jgi:hypothetical protein